MGRRCAGPTFVDAIALGLGRAMLALLGFIAAWLTLGKRVKRYARIPAPAFTGVLLDSPLRRALQPPEAVLAAAGIAPGMTVLEVGPGPGTYTTEAARRALPGGRVIAVDVQAGMLAQLQRKADRLGLTNIEPRLADAYHLPVGV
ncbi:MAG: class I SAM-dependent methyltransferase [Anaerolineae bacterium]